MRGSHLHRWLLFGALIPGSIAFGQRSLSPIEPTAKIARADNIPGDWQFDVASIRPGGNPDRRSRIFRHPEDMEFGAQNASLLLLLQAAFAVSESRIIGLPAALTSARFDIQAKGDIDTDSRFRKLNPNEQRLAKQKMVQRMLAERCKLAVHFETRDLPVYELVAAHNGPKLNPSQQAETSGWGGWTHIEIEGGDTLGRLAEELTRVSGRPVLNRTGLHGRYDIELDWAADDDEDAEMPTLFTAIREQLGLALEPRKAQIEVVVIDHMELPSEN